MKKLFMICAIILQYKLTFGQIVLKCAGKTYTIPAFKAGYTKIGDERFEQFKILPPIHQSQFDIELRGYYRTSNPLIGSVVVVKGNTEKLLVEAYFYKYQWGIVSSVKTFQPADSLLNSLIKANLFTLNDIHVITDSLLKSNIVVKRNNAFDPYSMQFELKVNDQYRSFNCDPFVYYANEKIKDLLPEKLLYDQFNKLYILSGQEKNHLFP